MNVFLFPTDDRSGQAAMIHHYATSGHTVYIPAYGTLGLNWEKIATWPALLCGCLSNPSVSNLQKHGFNRERSFFGEDSFLAHYDVATNTDVLCEIVSERDVPKIDVWHSLRGAEESLLLYRSIASRLFPEANWVSSSLNHYNSDPHRLKPRNVAKFIPASYEHAHKRANNINVMCYSFEAKLLGVDIDVPTESRTGVASFNHNFVVRQPVDYEQFTSINSKLVAGGYDAVTNYGGNIRSHGSDTRYSGDNGITGKFVTLNPKQAYELTARSRGVLLLKQTDWGGGTFYYCLNSCTPLVTSARYAVASHSEKYIIDGYNAVVSDDTDALVDAIARLHDDESYAKKLSDGMRSVRDAFFTKSYWDSFSEFIDNAR